MKIEYLKVEEITPYDRNPRHNEEAVEMVRKSIDEFGFNVPILLDKDHVIIAGHTRWEAAQGKLETVPCIILDELDEKKARQYRIIDNKTAEHGIWDYEKLIDELSDIKELDMSIFEFGDLNRTEDEEALDEEDERFTSNLDQSFEIELDDFGDEAFEYECPYCGFMWNE